MARPAVAGGGHLATTGTGWTDRAHLEEFHPHGTRYESPQAPIALAYFPFNRCDVHACTRCGCAVLRYTEYGGYYIDPRARLVDASLVVPDQDDVAG
jgi:hypothetical protein